MAPTGMEDLPDELLLNIIDHFSIRNRYDLNFKTWDGAHEIDSRVIALYKLSLVSRKLHRIVNPLLYSVLTRGATAKYRRRFLRAIIRRPHLGALVDEVRFSYFDWDAGEKGIPSEYADAAKLVNFGHDASNAAFQTIPAGEHTDSDVALLFSRLTNLRILEFEADETWFHTFKWLLSLVRRAAETGSGPLSSLRHLKATYGNENRSGFNPLFIQDWAALPALKSIEVVGAWSDERDGGRPLSLPSNNNIETLALWQSIPESDFLVHALEAFGNLKAFHYSQGPAPGLNHISPTLLFTLLQGLTARQDTMEHITILADNREDPWGTQGILPPLSHYFSFRDFTLLKHLELSEFILMGGPTYYDDTWGQVENIDVFPPSLEVLRLQCYEGLREFQLPMFEFLLRNAPTRVPNLRRIEILRCGKQVGDGEFDNLGAIAHSYGFEFETVEWDDWKHQGLATAGVC